jgi:hypothetical protein
MIELARTLIGILLAGGSVLLPQPSLEWLDGSSVADVGSAEL